VRTAAVSIAHVPWRGVVATGIWSGRGPALARGCGIIGEPRTVTISIAHAPRRGIVATGIRSDRGPVVACLMCDHQRIESRRHFDCTRSVSSSRGDRHLERSWPGIACWMCNHRPTEGRHHFDCTRSIMQSVGDIPSAIRRRANRDDHGRGDESATTSEPGAPEKITTRITRARVEVAGRTTLGSGVNGRRLACILWLFDIVGRSRCDDLRTTFTKAIVGPVGPGEKLSAGEDPSRPPSSKTQRRAR